MLFLPVTRPWAIEPVVSAIVASDIPPSVNLLIDAPGCRGWVDAFLDYGWAVRVRETGNPTPPESRQERRNRHLAMRLLSQEMMGLYPGRILYLEDDTIVPENVWGRLSWYLDADFEAASGIQRARHEHKLYGVWRFNHEAQVWDVMDVSERRSMTGLPFVHEADAVGHYCFLTTGVDYGRHPIQPLPNEPIDIAHTKHFAPIGVDPTVVCGHLLETGEILW